MNTKAGALLPLLSVLASCTTAGSDDEGASNDTSGGSSTTGSEDQFCGLSDQGPDAPWFELYERNTSLDEMGTLYLECGPQGSFMFEIDPVIGGLIPEGDYVPFQAELDVDGFNVLSSGHFSEADFEIFVGCCAYAEYDPYACFYETYTLILFPPDQLMDKSVLHGATGTLHVTMTAPDEIVERDFDIDLWAIDDGTWEYCEYY